MKDPYRAARLWPGRENPSTRKTMHMSVIVISILLPPPGWLLAKRPLLQPLTQHMLIECLACVQLGSTQHKEKGTHQRENLSQLWLQSPGLHFTPLMWGCPKSAGPFQREKKK